MTSINEESNNPLFFHHLENDKVEENSQRSKENSRHSRIGAHSKRTLEYLEGTFNSSSQSLAYETKVRKYDSLPRFHFLKKFFAQTDVVKSLNFDKFNSFQLTGILLNELVKEPNRLNLKGYTALQEAVSSKNYKMVSFLLEIGADPIANDKDGYSPLWHAIFSEDMEMIKLLLDHGVDLNQPCGPQLTPLIYAVNKGNVEIVNLFLDRGADINQSCGSQLTPLIYAVSKGNVEIVNLLLDRGADINRRDLEGNCSAFYTALMKGDEELIQIFIDRGADTSSELRFDQKFLAHVWGIEGRSQWVDSQNIEHEFDLEGFDSIVGIRLLREYVEEFFSQGEVFDIPNAKAIQQELLNSMKPRLTEEAVEAVRKGESLLFMGGLENHAIGIVFYDNTLVVCNRGLGSDTALYYYEFPSSQITEEIIEKLQKRYENIQEFNQIVRDLNLKLFEKASQKDQKVGNCVWASAKASFGALCVLYAYRVEDKGWKGVEIYKDFTSFVRRRVLEKYKEKYPSLRDPFTLKVIEKSTHKFRNKALPSP